MSDTSLIAHDGIQKLIRTFRGVQVILDSDLAALYQVEVKALNQAVKRNFERFPHEFMFQLSAEEHASLRSQNVTLKEQRGLHRKYLPYVFTEQGVAMLSAVLRSETAIHVSIRIMNAFVALRRFVASNAQVFERIATLEVKQIETDKRIDKVLNAIERKDTQPRQGIFFDGQVFDAYVFLSDLFRSAKESILIIDNYIDDTVLTHLAKRGDNVKVCILTRAVSRQLQLDVAKFNQQYQPIGIKEFKNAHDRFLIVDDAAVYHFGASLKDLGRKWFAFSKMEIGAVEMLRKVRQI